MSGGLSVFRLCLVTDRDLAGGRGLADIVAAAVRGGVTMVQLREKTAAARAFLEQGRILKALLAGSGVPLIINDRVDIALELDADGVHVGQGDMPLAQVRALVGADKIIGLSVTNASQALQADAAAADYLGIGPVFTQATKRDAAAVLGIDGFADLRRLARNKPVLAIGGIKAQHAPALRAAGADGLAVVSAIMDAADPEAAARAFGAVP